MRIATVIDRYYPIGGGVQQFVRGACLHFRARGNEVTIVTRSIEGEPGEEVRPEGRILRTPVLDLALADPGAALARAAELAEVIRPLGADVVFANHHASLASIRAAQLLEVPVVYAMHGWGILCSLRQRLLRPNGELCLNDRTPERCRACKDMASPFPAWPAPWHPLRFAGRCKNTLLRRHEVRGRVTRHDGFQAILESADARIVSAERWRPFYREPTEALPYGLDSDEWRPADPAPFMAAHGISAPYVLLAGRVHNTKGQDDALRALALMPDDVTLVLAGAARPHDGVDTLHERRVRDLAAELGLTHRVVMTGQLGAEDLREAYSGAIATLMPSVWLESFGYVAAEAMACACPVVVSETSGAAEIVRDGTDGFVVPRRDPEALAQAVQAISLRRHEMGLAARERVIEKMGWELIGDRLLEILEGVRT